MKSKYRFSLPGITKLKEKRKGTKGIKRCKKTVFVPRNLENVNKKQRIR